MSWRKPTSFFVACITMPKATTGVKRPRDTNQLAKLMVDILTGQVEDREPTPEERGIDSAEAIGARRGLVTSWAGLPFSDFSRNQR